MWPEAVEVHKDPILNCVCKVFVIFDKCITLSLQNLMYKFVIVKL